MARENFGFYSTHMVQANLQSLDGETMTQIMSPTVVATVLRHYLLDCDNCQPYHSCHAFARQAGMPASPQTSPVPNTYVTDSQIQLTDLFKGLDRHFIVLHFKITQVTGK